MSKKDIRYKAKVVLASDDNGQTWYIQRVDHVSKSVDHHDFEFCSESILDNVFKEGLGIAIKCERCREGYIYYEHKLKAWLCERCKTLYEPKPRKP